MIPRGLKHMKRTLKRAVVIVILGLSFAVSAAAGPYEDDVTASRDAAAVGDYATTLRLMRPWAINGFAEAQRSLGVIYAEGLGVPQNYAEAIKWLRLAADQGLAAARYGLGGMYLLGHGVPQNYAEAGKWLRLAADQGLEEGQFALGRMYAEGLGVPQDYVRAYMWLDLAAAQWTLPLDSVQLQMAAMAGEKRDQIAKLMTSAQIAQSQKLAHEWRPTAPVRR